MIDHIQPRKVLIVDDSAVVRQVLSTALSQADGLQVVGAAVNPYDARNKIVALKPDVLTLDIEMPRMDGLTFLGKLMRYYPMPVVVFSSLTPAGGEIAMRALQLGAVDVLAKPTCAYSVDSMTDTLVATVRAAAYARLAPRVPDNPAGQAAPAAIGVFPPVKVDERLVIAIGASTGGTLAIEHIATRLPATSPGIVAVQHMPKHFTTRFAERLNDLSQIEVREAADGDRVQPGLFLLAPGDHHMVIRRRPDGYVVNLKDGPRVHYQRPSVDVLFHSVANQVGKHAIGVILTGMGSDGAEGLLAMRNAEAVTLAQDEESCVVFGMPREAIRLNAAQEVHSLTNIPGRLVHHMQGRKE